MAQREAGDGRHRDTRAIRRMRMVRTGAACVLTVAAGVSASAWHSSIGRGSVLEIRDGAVASGPTSSGETLGTTAPGLASAPADPSTGGSATGTLSPDAAAGPAGTTRASTGRAGQSTLLPGRRHTATAKPTTTRATTRTTPPSAPPKPSTPPASAAPTTPSGVMTGPEQQIVDLTNAARAKAGCAPLTANSALVAAARDHANDMVAGQYFAHTSPSGVTPQDRATKFGFTGGVGENIEAGSAAASDAFNAWYSEGPSGGHYQNIVNCSYKYIGVGFNAGAIQPYGPGVWAQMFG